MAKHLISCILILATLTFPQKISAIKAYPHPVNITQPDGQIITVRFNGDEFHHFYTTEDGYLIKKNKSNFFVYSAIESEEIIAKNSTKRSPREKALLQEASSTNLSLIQRTKAAKVIDSQRRANRAVNNGFPLTGSPKSLVILVNFTDKSFVIPNPKIAFTNLLNEVGYATNGGTGSARDYFKAASFDQFSPDFDVVGPYTLPQNMSYYGGNDSEDYDKDPQQMVIDACDLADQNGIDFSQYDTDDDGIVDNIFIYYAGYNEAEYGGDDTVWPHRWALNNYNTKFDGKSIYDYACTSELQGDSGTDMCGIGTFCHEFGHVLGLPDYYATDGSTHYTLDYWNIMDYGGYLNEGRTPPTYSAYDRFYLDWLQPIEIKTAQDITLEPLLSSNKAYLITQNGNHNLNGANPSPTEFFMLENRQNTGWDTYLPGKGMLITRINYNSSTWDDNSPNNNASSMGVDIMEADGIGSQNNQSADPFPGTANITNYNPTLRSGTNINKPITNIAENNGIISFSFMGGAPSAIITINGTLNPFNTINGTASTLQSLNITASLLTNNLIIGFSNDVNFELKLSSESNWSKSLTISPVSGSINETIQIRYNPESAGSHNTSLTVSSFGVETKTQTIQGTATVVYIEGQPYVEAGLVTDTLAFPTTNTSRTKTKNLNIKTTDLVGNLSFTISGDNAAMFTLSTSSISKNEANAETGANIKLSYKPTSIGTHKAILTIAGGGLPTKTIQLTGTGL